VEREAGRENPVCSEKRTRREEGITVDAQLLRYVMNRKEISIDFLYTHHRKKRFMTGHSIVSVTSIGGAGSQNSHGRMAEALLGGLRE